MMIGEAVGFPTNGTSLLTAEIPAHAHTGRHLHGEEAIFILSGHGNILIDRLLYHFHAGSTIHVPYMGEHQIINIGDEPVRYLSAMTPDLDLFVRLGRVNQTAIKGVGEPVLPAGTERAGSKFAPDGRRIVLLEEEMLDEYARRAAERDGHDHHKHTHGAIWVLMGGREGPSSATNDFRASAAAMTNIFEEVPGTSSHKHSHTEAVLYALEGHGYSEVDGKRYDWSAGDALHIPPRMTVHEHFNETEARTRTLRVEFGIRYFYEALWGEYEKIELREESTQR
jgi:quercetin dioxygenase-like cupin family protein